MNKLIVFPLFFFLSFSISAFAYTDYAYNPLFTSDINGLVIYAPNYANINYTYNATCSGLTGCLLLYTNASEHYQVILKNKDAASPVTVHYDNVSGYSDYYNNLPIYTEGIVTLNMQFNGTPSNIPYVQVLNADPATAPGTWTALNYTEISATTNVWHNVTITIPASTSVRHVAVLLNFYPDNPTALTMIDKFKFYTFDVTTARQSIFTDYATESAFYCGEATQTNRVYNEIDDTPGSYFNVLVSNLTYDNIDCCAFQYNYTVKARSCVSGVNNSAVEILYHARDISYMAAYEGSGGYILVHALSNNQILYTRRTLAENSNYYAYLNYNGGNSFLWSSYLLNKSHIPVTDIYQIKDISAYNLSGTLWRQKSGGPVPTYYYSPFYPLFSESPFIPTCTCTDSVETCLFYPNDVKTTTCGSCGCDLNAQYCLINSTESSHSGTWCDTNDTAGLAYFTFINDPASCTQYTTTGSCPTGTQCVFHATTRSIECFNNATGQHQICVDSNGLQVDCSTTGSTASLCWDGTSWVTCPDYTTNAGTALALWFGTFFGFGNNIVISRNITSILLTLIISIVIVILLAYAGVGGGALKAAFILSAMMLLVLFTLVLWFPSWLFVVMIVLTALGVSGLLGKTIGGG